MRFEYLVGGCLYRVPSCHTLFYAIWFCVLIADRSLLNWTGDWYILVVLPRYDDKYEISVFTDMLKLVQINKRICSVARSDLLLLVTSQPRAQGLSSAVSRETLGGRGSKRLRFRSDKQPIRDTTWIYVKLSHQFGISRAQSPCIVVKANQLTIYETRHQLCALVSSIEHSRDSA